MTLPAEQLLTTAEVAERLRVSPRTVYEWAQAGKIPHVRVGRSLRYYWSRIEVWLEQGQDASLSRRLDNSAREGHPPVVSD